MKPSAILPCTKVNENSSFSTFNFLFSIFNNLAVKTSSLLIVLLGMTILSCSAQKSVITTMEMPESSRSFVEKYFPGIEISYALKEQDFPGSYEVKLSNGMKIEFDKAGEWKEIDAEGQAVPGEIIPLRIKEQVEQQFPGKQITQIEKEKGKIEVKLSNGLELKFDAKYNLLEIDD